MDDCEDITIANKQIRHSLVWLSAFFAGRTGALVKVFDVRQWHEEPVIVIETDASPWGLGAALYVKGQLWAVISDEISDFDLRRFQLERGDCRG